MREKCFADAWNFGPGIDSNKTVKEMLIALKNNWPEINWQEVSAKVHEAQLLYLDNTKSRIELEWEPILSFEKTVELVVHWYQSWIEGKIISSIQIKEFQNLARERCLDWI